MLSEHTIKTPLDFHANPFTRLSLWSWLVLIFMPYTPADLTSGFKVGWYCTSGMDLGWGGMMNNICFLIAHAICHTPALLWLLKPRHCVTVSGWTAAAHRAVSAWLISPVPCAWDWVIFLLSALNKRNLDSWCFSFFCFLTHGQGQIDRCGSVAFRVSSSRVKLWWLSYVIP